MIQSNQRTSLVRLRNSTLAQSALWIMLLASSAIFIVRGPYRAVFQRGTDFAAPYVAGWRFYHGLNPYAKEGFVPLWHSLGAPAQASLTESDSRPVYPLSTLPVMGPFSVLSWRRAQIAYLASCSIFYVLLLLSLSRGLPSRNFRIAFVAYGLAFSPVLAGIGAANLSILTFTLVAYSVLLVEHKSAAAGILLGLAFCLKPTVAGPVVLLFLCFRCWRSLYFFAGVTGSVFLAAALRLRTIPGWYSSYLSNVAYLVGPDGAASYITPNEARFDLLNLQVPFYGMTHSIIVSNVLAFGLAGTLFVVWVWRYRAEKRITWPAVASLTMICLLPVYQRNYCAGFVLFAILWAGHAFSGNKRARVLLAFSIPLLVPGEALLRTYSRHIPSAFLEPIPMNLLFAYASWIIVAMILLILSEQADGYPVGRLSKFEPGSNLAIMSDGEEPLRVLR